MGASSTHPLLASLGGLGFSDMTRAKVGKCLLFLVEVGCQLFPCSLYSTLLSLPMARSLMIKRAKLMGSWNFLKGSNSSWVALFWVCRMVAICHSYPCIKAIVWSMTFPSGNPPILTIGFQKMVLDSSNTCNTYMASKMRSIHDITFSIHAHFLSTLRNWKSDRLMIKESGHAINQHEPISKRTKRYQFLLW